MNKISKLGAIVAIGLVSAIGLTACDSTPAPATQKDEVAKKAAKSETYIPKNTTELDNYNKAQKLYDDPNAIQFCTIFPSSASAPIVTTPIAGKLTTSSTSYFSPTEVWEGFDGRSQNIPARSVDGLFHGDSFYRYGFTPSGIYTDFSNSLEMMCSTGLTEFQRQNTYVEGVDTSGNMADKQKKAEAALKAGDSGKASDILAGK